MTSETPAHLDRLASLVDVAALSRVRVLLVGLGRVGCAILHQLIRLPIQKVIGVDHDEVSGQELGSVFPVQVNERFKARAAKQVVEFWNPYIKFEPVLMKLTPERMQRFCELVERADILFWAADDWPVFKQVCEALHDEIPMIGCAMAEEGRYAEIGWSLPRQTPPLASTLQASKKQSEAGAGSLPVFVDAAANVVVSVALGLVLSGRRGGDLFRDLIDPRHPLLVVHSADNEFSHSANAAVPRLVRLLPVGLS